MKRKSEAMTKCLSVKSRDDSENVGGEAVVKSVPVLLAVLIDNKCRDLVYSCWVTALIQLSISSAWPEGRHAGPRLISDGMSGHTFTDRENGEKKFSAMFLCFSFKKKRVETTRIFRCCLEPWRSSYFWFYSHRLKSKSRHPRVFRASVGVRKNSQRNEISTAVKLLYIHWWLSCSWEWRQKSTRVLISHISNAN